eukprot:GHVU01202896.1.p1 GENE.GHVU01202896.1~~GHVU01202896.1.p1  ORF type:complete len:466 (+),score=41.55 GHVU01202896.1:482-1879(+)
MPTHEHNVVESDLKISTEGATASFLALSSWSPSQPPPPRGCTGTRFSQVPSKWHVASIFTLWCWALLWCYCVRLLYAYSGNLSSIRDGSPKASGGLARRDTSGVMRAMVRGDNYNYDYDQEEDRSAVSSWYTAIAVYLLEKLVFITIGSLPAISYGLLLVRTTASRLSWFPPRSLPTTIVGDIFPDVAVAALLLMGALHVVIYMECPLPRTLPHTLFNRLEPGPSTLSGVLPDLIMVVNVVLFAYLMLEQPGLLGPLHVEVTKWGTRMVLAVRFLLLLRRRWGPWWLPAVYAGLLWGRNGFLWRQPSSYSCAEGDEAAAVAHLKEQRAAGPVTTHLTGSAAVVSRDRRDSCEEHPPRGKQQRVVGGGRVGRRPSRSRRAAPSPSQPNRRSRGQPRRRASWSASPRDSDDIPSIGGEGEGGGRRGRRGGGVKGPIDVVRSLVNGLSAKLQAEVRGLSTTFASSSPL